MVRVASAVASQRQYRVRPPGKTLAPNRYLKAVSNSLGAHVMKLDERPDELAELLAAGLTRLRERQSRALSADLGESLLDRAFLQSGHANVLKGGLV